MGEYINLLKTAGPKMVPFIKAVVLYFMLFTYEKKGLLWTTVLKCAPIICLMIFIALYGINFTQSKHSYSRKIFVGLIFSCIGDALLNIDLFPHGMGAFAIAQTFYISAFGFKPIRPKIGIVLYTIAIIFVGLVYKSLDEILIIGLPVYAFLLTTMCWRALAAAGSSNDVKVNLVKNICGIGSILFVISDGIIAVDKFMIPISNARIYIMSTYYAAQFAIALSIVAHHRKSDGNSSKSPNEKTSIGNKKSK